MQLVIRWDVLNKLIVVIMTLMMYGCGYRVVKETECIVKPTLPPIELGMLIFPKMYGELLIEPDTQSICLPIDNFIQVVDNNKNIEFYIKRCGLIKETYESYYGVTPKDKK